LNNSRYSSKSIAGGGGGPSQRKFKLISESDKKKSGKKNIGNMAGNEYLSPQDFINLIKCEP
jgi:hypothetical protein